MSAIYLESEPALYITALCGFLVLLFFCLARSTRMSTTASSIAVCEGSTSLATMKSTFLDKVSSRILLDASRRVVVEDAATTLDRLVRGKLVGQNGFMRLLVGSKGVGKTCLLENIAQVATSMFSKLVYCGVNYGSEDQRLPLEIIAAKLGLPSEGLTVKTLEQELEKRGKYLLVTIDQFQSIFGEFPNGKTAILQVSAIGESRVGRIHCVLSGSSTELRQLCFAKLPDDQKARFPNYFGRDLNATKFSGLWIHPFLDAPDFRQLIEAQQEHMIQISSPHPVDSQLADLYVHTGGIPRLLYNPKSSSWTTTLKELTQHGPEYDVLKAIYRTVTTYMGVSSASQLEYFTSSTQFVPLSVVQHESSTASDVTLLYTLADRGFIRFRDAPHNKQVSLGSPMLFLELATEGGSIDATEAAALKICQSPYAEQVAFRLMAKNPSWIDVSIRTPLFLELQLATADIVCPQTDTMALHSLRKETFGPQKDELGADAVVLTHGSAQGKFIAHRIQLTLGQSEIDEEQTGKIINRFQSTKQLAFQAYERSGLPLQEMILYLATTRGMRQEARAMLSKANIIVVDDSALKPIWPPEVQRLGKPYK